ncbi:YegP family protein [Paracoccus mutanolyticus]|uniref:YegP family protein n=1 Tax=Paracoccus mutanolyticus TaxID=1499308 RepID=UPI001675E381|nr:YegP family protein [Paracoccus mutanolyticus]
MFDDGQQYTVRVKWKNRRDWIKAGTITAIANPGGICMGPGIFAITSLRIDENEKASAPKSSGCPRSQAWCQALAISRVSNPVFGHNGAAAPFGDSNHVRNSQGTARTGYWWRLKASNGQVLCHSEQYTSKQSAGWMLTLILQGAWVTVQLTVMGCAVALVGSTEGPLGLRLSMRGEQAAKHPFYSPEAMRKNQIVGEAPEVIERIKSSVARA